MLDYGEYIGKLRFHVFRSGFKTLVSDKSRVWAVRHASSAAMSADPLVSEPDCASALLN